MFYNDVTHHWQEMWSVPPRVMKSIDEASSSLESHRRGFALEGGRTRTGPAEDSNQHEFGEAESMSRADRAVNNVVREHDVMRQASYQYRRDNQFHRPSSRPVHNMDYLDRADRATQLKAHPFWTDTVFACNL